MVEVDGPHDDDDPVEALADDLYRRGEDPLALLDLDDVPEFVAEVGEDGKEVEPEWLTNPDAFPNLDTMALPVPRRKGGRRHRVGAAQRRNPPSPSPPPPATQPNPLPATPPNPAPATPPRSGVRAKKRKQCEHCGTVETPQWRRGPGLLHTLCNVCGLRVRKDNLLQPEYRPKNSPTFSPDLHSNRRRRKNESAKASAADATGGN